MSCYLFLTFLLRVNRRLRKMMMTMSLATAQSLASLPPLLPLPRPPWSSPWNPPLKPPPSPSSPPSSPTRTRHAGTTSEASPATTSPSSTLRTNPTTRSLFPTSPTSTLGRARAMTWSTAMRWRSLSRCTNHRSVWASWTFYTSIVPKQSSFQCFILRVASNDYCCPLPKILEKHSFGGQFYHGNVNPCCTVKIRVKSGQHICEKQK